MVNHLDTTGRQALASGIALLALLLALPGFGSATLPAKSRVTYHAYSEETFRLAQRTGKPMFIVLGAKWCYWCRTYEQATLESDAVSSFLNRHFLNVRVDIDERQDLQHRYVRRGIPTSVILRPDGRTYLTFSGILAPTDFLAGMRQVLTGLADPEREHRPRFEYSVHDIRPLLETKPVPALTADMVGRLAEDFYAVVLANFDLGFAGFGAEQKYPQGALLYELLVVAAPQQEPALQQTALTTLDRIQAHLLDKVDGGFHRYAERRDWSSVRYEKMLTTNAQLVRAFQYAGEQSGSGHASLARRKEYTAVAAQTLRYVLDTFQHAEPGGFAGSVEGTSQRYFRSTAQERARMAKPAVNASVFTAWNGEAVVALADVYRAAPDPRLRQAIRETLSLLQSRLFTAGQGMYSRLEPETGAVRGLGQLSDNAWAALAFAVGAELTGESRYRDALKGTLDYAIRELWLPEVSAFRAWNIPAGDGVRPEERTTEAVPLQENAVMGLALIRAHGITGEVRYLGLAQRLLAAISVLEPDLFDDNANDGGKRYLEAFAHYHRALRELMKRS